MIQISKLDDEMRRRSEAAERTGVVLEDRKEVLLHGLLKLLGVHGRLRALHRVEEREAHPGRELRERRCGLPASRDEFPP